MNSFIQIFTLLIFNSIYIFGFFNAGTYQLRSDIKTAPKKIKRSMIEPESREFLSYFRIWIDNNFGEFYAKPIITCPVCMASLHSIIPYFLYFWRPTAVSCAVFDVDIFFYLPADIFHSILYPFYICALAALNKAAKRLFVDE